MITNETLRVEANALKDQLISVRRDLHMHPELGFQEVRTAGIVAQRLGNWVMKCKRAWARRVLWRSWKAPRHIRDNYPRYC